MLITVYTHNDTHTVGIMLINPYNFRHIIRFLINKLSRDTKFPTRLHVRIAKSQISLRTRRRFGFWATLKVHCKDSDQTARMYRLIWVFTWCTCELVGNAVYRLNWYYFITWKNPYLQAAIKSIRLCSLIARSCDLFGINHFFFCLFVWKLMAIWFHIINTLTYL